MKSLATLLKVAQRRLDELGAEAGRIGTEIAALQERETSIRAREQAEAYAARGIVGKTQDDIVRSITSFALYGFPESHAISFALIADG